MIAAVRLSFDDIWRPDQPLPDGPTLDRLAARILLAWAAADLRGRFALAYNPAMRTALGRALLREGRVELNARLLMREPGQLIPTLAHELAHLVVHHRHGRQPPHGTRFGQLMRSIRMTDQATHKMDVGDLRRGRRRYLYRHQCATCGAVFIARSVRRNVYCRACGPPGRWIVHRSQATAEGLAALQKLGADATPTSPTPGAATAPDARRSAGSP
jgi:predicted SprT family Zn-dependent metalloprotease